MLRKQISPRAAALATVVVLAAIQLVYWRLLVYRGSGSGRMGGGSPRRLEIVVALGREDVMVDTLVGDEPGCQDGPAWRARLNGPNALAVAPDGRIFVADSRNHRIRVVSPLGEVATRAGGGDPGGEGGMSDGPALQARLRYPSGIALDGETLYVADTGNHRICRVAGDPQAGALLTTLAGGGEGRADGTGQAARFRFPAALFLGPDGALWVADLGNRTVRRVTLSGGVTTPGSVPAVVREALGESALDSSTAARRESRPPEAIHASPEARGFPVATQFTLGRRSGGVRPAGRPLLFADVDSHTLLGRRPGEGPLLLAGRRQAGMVIPGSGSGQGHRAHFSRPCAVAMAPDGTTYVADFEGNSIRRVRLPRWYLEGEPAPFRPVARRRGVEAAPYRPGQLPFGQGAARRPGVEAAPYRPGRGEEWRRGGGEEGRNQGGR